MNKSKSKEDLLIAYCEYNNIHGVADFLLKYPNININHANKYGYTALMYASSNGKTEYVELLLKHPNINVNYAKKEDGYTALIYASKTGHTDIV